MSTELVLLLIPLVAGLAVIALIAVIDWSFSPARRRRLIARKEAKTLAHQRARRNR